SFKATLTALGIRVPSKIEVPSFKATLTALGIRVPSKIEVPITDFAQSVRPGQFRAATTWGPWVRVGIGVLTGVFALLTLAVAGWAGIEVGRR
ncbi:hypothetical protein H7I57_24165, partial [Mycobacterium pyrenivorans]|nr:hypothetical protein [Mycolicibacterium pyrenivorans]